MLCGNIRFSHICPSFPSHFLGISPTILEFSNPSAAATFGGRWPDSDQSSAIEPPPSSCPHGRLSTSSGTSGGSISFARHHSLSSHFLVPASYIQPRWSPRLTPLSTTKLLRPAPTLTMAAIVVGNVVTPSRVFPTFRPFFSQPLAGLRQPPP